MTSGGRAANVSRMASVGAIRYFGYQKPSYFWYGPGSSRGPTGRPGGTTPALQLGEAVCAPAFADDHLVVDAVPMGLDAALTFYADTRDSFYYSSITNPKA